MPATAPAQTAPKTKPAEHGSSKTPLVNDFEIVAGLAVDYADLQALVTAAGQAPWGGFEAALAGHVCWDQVLRAMAAEAVTDNPDGYTGHGRHYFLHADASGRFSLLPWCLDETFNGGYSSALAKDGVRSVLYQRCLSEPGCNRRYQEALLQAVEQMRRFDVPGRLQGQAALLDPHDLPDVVPVDADSMRAELSTRHAEYLAALEAAARCALDAEDDTDGDDVPCRLDCDPRDPANGAGAPEVCGDWSDDDCSGLLDDGPYCPPCQEFKVGPHRYRYCSTPLPWPEARAHCQADGSDLAILGTHAEIHALGSSYRGPQWVGLSDRSEEGLFRWVDGSPLNEGAGWRWADGGRDGVADRDCVALDRWSQAYSASCEVALPFTCEDTCAAGLDEDGDGHLQCGDDCNDGDAAINPGAHDFCDGADANCDGFDTSCDD